MKCSTTVNVLAIGAQGGVVDLGGLYADLDRLSDKRKARGKRYSLALVLVLMVLAKLCGEDRPYGMAEWIHARARSLIEALGLSYQHLPSHCTLRRVLQGAVDPGQLQSAVNRFLRRNARLGQSVLLSLDGKTLRGSWNPSQGQAVHLLAAYLPAEGVVLLQVPVPSRENEIVAAPRILRRLDLRGKVVIADAMLTQRELSLQIVAAGGSYIWQAKKNQPRLQEAIARLFMPPIHSPGWGTPPHDFQRAVLCNKGHGRLEERTLTSSEMLNGYLDWPHVAQVFQLERRRIRLKDGTCQTETVYGLTSLTRQQADPSRLQALVRDHWRIENNVFRRRDVTLHEDATRMTNPNMAHAMTILNNLVIAFVGHQGWRYLPQARRYYDANPLAVLTLLLHPPGRL
jgi:predicted transposase YbfD/YdcC